MRSVQETKNQIIFLIFTNLESSYDYYGSFSYYVICILYIGIIVYFSMGIYYLWRQRQKYLSHQ